MKLYAACIMASRYNAQRGGWEQEVDPVSLLAASDGDAARRLQSLAAERWNAADGWANHRAGFIVVPEQHVREAAGDAYHMPDRTVPNGDGRAM